MAETEPTRIELTTDQHIQLIECPYCCALILADKWPKHINFHQALRVGVPL